MVSHPNPKDSTISSRHVRTKTYAIYEDQIKYLKQYMGDSNASGAIRQFFDEIYIPKTVHPELENEVHKIFVTEIPALRTIKGEEEQAVYLFKAITRLGLVVTVYQAYIYIKNHKKLLAGE